MMDSSNSSSNPSLVSEIGPDGLLREAPVIAYTERIIEEEQLQLRKYIEENYSKIRDVERELSNLNMEIKLTAGPKKAALEHLRKKIEVSNEKIREAKLKEEQAKKAWEAASSVLKEEESVKQKLCEDLNKLVQESSTSQFSRLEELKRRLEALNPSRVSAVVAQDRISAEPAPAQNSKATETPSNPNTAKPSTAEPGNASSQGNSSNIPAVNVQNQQPPMEGEAKKKKIQFQGKGRGLGAIARGRGSQAPGWTGAGFDVDGRN